MISTHLKVGILEVDLCQLMGRTRYVDDDSFSSKNLAHNEVREQEMAQMVRSEMHFKSVCRLRVVFYGHDASIVDHGVEAVNARVDCLRCPLHRGVVAEVERDDRNVNLRIDLLDLVHDRLDLGLAATGENNALWIGRC